MRDSDRLALARERLCAVQVATAYLRRRVDDGDCYGAESAVKELLDATLALEAALGQPVTPRSLFQGVEGGGM